MNQLNYCLYLMENENEVEVIVLTKMLVDQKLAQLYAKKNSQKQRVKSAANDQQKAAAQKAYQGYDWQITLLTYLQKELYEGEGNDKGLNRMDIQEEIWELKEELDITVELMVDARTFDETQAYFAQFFELFA